MSSPRTVAILVFDDVEILDFAGPCEVFNVAGEVTTPAGFYVYNVGISMRPVIGRGRFTVTPHYSRGKAGLLDNRSPTTHHTAFEALKKISPRTTIVEGQRFVQAAPRIMTAGGISAGIDLSLHMVDLIAGRDVRAATEEEMEYKGQGGQ